MNAEQLAEALAHDLDNGWRDGFDAWVSAHAEGASLVVEVEHEGEMPRRFLAVLLELDETDPDAVPAFYKAGQTDMLRRVLEEAETFRGLMKRRRYFNNANGVGRFVEYLRTKLAAEEGK